MIWERSVVLNTIEKLFCEHEIENSGRFSIPEMLTPGDLCSDEFFSTPTLSLLSV